MKLGLQSFCTFIRIVGLERVFVKIKGEFLSQGRLDQWYFQVHVYTHQVCF